MAGVAASVLAGSLVLAACSSSDTSDENTTAADGGASTAVVTVNGGEPQNPLLPANTNETNGGKITDMIFAGLVYYDAEGSTHNEVAESIETEDNQTYTITLKDGWTFSDGTPITSKSFVDAWNYGALLSNAQANSYFFETIEGFSWDVDSELTGLKVVDDKTFTVTLTAPDANFPLRLGYTAFAPLPESAFADMAAFGENPIASGPYMLDGEGAWEHNVQATLVPNPEYKGERVPQNGGVTVKFYDTQDAAYNDLLGGNLDVIDAIPDSAFATYEDELAGRSVNQPAAIFQSFTFPEYLPEFAGEAGHLRRQAISHAINRQEITETIFQGTRTPATDFTSPVVNGWSDSIPGSEVLAFDPEKAKELWAQAEAIEPYTGTFFIAYNADGGHQTWVDAVANSIRNTLGIDVEGQPYPAFQALLDDRDAGTMKGAFRSGWQFDWPGMDNSLGAMFATGAGSNDGQYTNPEFDALLKEAATAGSVDEATTLYQKAQEILFTDLPQVPLWYSNVNGGWAEGVENVEFSWNSIPQMYEVTKN
nr:ABC transporter substrate-binding protein [Georgenia sp. SYP-B2076]